MAIEEIFKETKRAEIRANEVGATGWSKCPLRKPNKRFLNNTMRSVISHNSRHEARRDELSSRRLKELDRRRRHSRSESEDDHHRKKAKKSSHESKKSKKSKKKKKEKKKEKSKGQSD